MKILSIFTLMLICSVNSISMSMSMNDTLYLNRKFAMGLKTKIYYKDNQEFLHVSGFSGHSSYAVKEIRSKVDGNILLLSIELIPVSATYRNGNFSIELKLAPEVQKVALDSKNYVIWERTSSVKDN